MKVTYYGHSCFNIEINGSKVLFDPFISPNELAKDIDVDSIEADYVLLSHGHEDHVADAEDILNRTGAKLISNFEIVNWYGEKGIDNAHPLNHGGGIDEDFGRIVYVYALHSSVLPDGSYGGNPGGFVIESDEGNFYYAGDTDVMMEMKIIPERRPLDFVMLPIGDNFTMDIDGAVRAAEYLQCDDVIGMHYDTFGWIEIDHEEAQQKFKDAGKNLHLIDIGDSIDM
jgi:L-ascorbate metabolism protein UlaG (beta-lactamase superfamily)